MIILITGASHTGKTLLAQRLLEEYKYPYLSIDHLKMGLIRSGQTTLTPEDDDALTEYLWPIVREMIKTAIENQQNMIVEGCYIPSDWRKNFDNQYLQSIRFICLAMTDEYIDTHFDEIRKHASVIETRLHDTDVTPEALKTDNHNYIESFTHHGEKITRIGSNFEEAAKTLIGMIGTIKIIETGNRGTAIVEQLLRIWESSVRQTHTFLSESEIERIKAYIPDAISRVERLLVFDNDENTPIAFIGIEGGRIEMLFVDANHRGLGIGKLLTAYSINHYDVNEVTVNEQNPQAIGFYEHLGFCTYKRTELDEEGSPYPLLYMRLAK